MAISKDNVKSNFMELSGLDSTSAEVYAGLRAGRLYANLRRQRRYFTDLFV